MEFKPNFDQFLKVLHREQPDYVPFYEHLADRTVMEQFLDRPCPPIHNTRESKIQYMKFFSAFYSNLGFDCIPIEFGMPLFSLGGQHGGGRSWADHDVATIQNIEEFDEYPWPEPDKAIDYDLLEAAGKTLPKGMKVVAGVAGGVQEHVITLLGLKKLSKVLRTDPKFVEKMFEKIGFLIREVDKIIAEKDFVGALRMGDDMGYKTATLLHPKTIRQYVFPQQKQIVEVAHKQHKPFILHSCGNLSEIIEDLITDVKIDAWHSFQDLILPITEAKIKFGHRVALLGGVDLDKLCRATPAELDAYCKNLLERCKIDGGFAFGTGNSVASYVPVENYRLMLQYGRKYGKY